MNPFDYFDRIYCINLDYRKDRWEKVTKEFTSLGILDKVTRVPGVITHEFDDPKRNACVGNHLSHAKCIQDALYADRILILEDDVKFINNTLEVLKIALSQLPPWWDLFYLGANLERPTYQLSSHLAKLSFAYSTHAYAINMQNDELTDILEQMNTNTETIHNDVYMSEHIIPFYCSFISIPMIAIQESSYSDIEKKFVNYDWMEERFNNQLVRKNVGNQT